MVTQHEAVQCQALVHINKRCASMTTRENIIRNYNKGFICVIYTCRRHAITNFVKYEKYQKKGAKIKQRRKKTRR